MNFADNHDVTRVASILTDKNQLTPLYGLLFAMPGMPCLYYGSEWGATGRKEDADPARLGAQVVSGIGFLGAGAIMKEGLSITGLTTAACLWVVAGVGLAVGAGFYVEAIMTTVLVVVTVGTLSHWELKWSARASILRVCIYSENIPEQLSIISSCLEEMGVDIKSVKIREEYDKNSREQCIMLVMELTLINSDHIKNICITNGLQSLRGIKGVEVR